MIQKNATSFFQPWSPFDAVSPQSPNWLRGGAMPHRVAATWVYDLPFGKGRQYLSGPVVGHLVGGWTFSGTYEYGMGGLLGFGNNFYYGDLVKIKLENPTFGQYFNTAGCVTSNPGPGDTVVPANQPCTQGWDKRAGNQPGTYQARTLPVNIAGIRNPNFHQTNASVARSFRIWETLQFQMRLDALNVFNRSYVAGPSTNPTSSNFGQIISGATNLNRFIQIQGRIRW
jgi:hypothetical protein